MLREPKVGPALILLSPQNSSSGWWHGGGSMDGNWDLCRGLVRRVYGL